MRARPTVEVKTTPSVHPGGEVVIEVALTSPSRTPIDRVRVELRLEERVAGQSSPRVELKETRVVATALVLEAGERRSFRAVLDLPREAPPSYEGARVTLRYVVEVVADIPWWPSARVLFERVVTQRPRARPDPAPVLMTSPPIGGPRLELTMDDRAFSPGDVLRGSFALSHARGAGPHEVKIALVGYEDVRGARREAFRFETSHAPSIEGEREVPFRVAIPAVASPSFAWNGTSLAWLFELRADVGKPLAMDVPIELASFEQRRVEGTSKRQVGRARWRVLFGELGAARGLALHAKNLELAGAIAGLEASLFTNLEGRLSAKLTFGDALAIEARVARRGVAVGPPKDEDLARLFASSSRFPCQLAALLDAPLMRALAPFEVVLLDDDGVLLEGAEWDYEAPSLQLFADRVASAASRLADAPKRISPPPGLEAFALAWERFARACSGRFLPGPMRIVNAKFEDLPLRIETSFQGSAVVGARAALGLLGHEGSARDRASARDWPEAARLGLDADWRALVEQTEHVEIGHGGLVFHFAGPLEDPERISGLLSSGASLVHAHREGRRGPYR